MKTKKCKYCGKEINVKAEICPHCGCRVKSNTLKFIIICLIVIVILIGAYFGVKYVKKEMDKKKEIEAEKQAEISKQELIEKYTKFVESYSGNYTVSYNKELFNADHPIFELKDNVSILDKVENMGCIGSKQLIVNDKEEEQSIDYCDLGNIDTISVDNPMRSYAWTFNVNSDENILYTNVRMLTKATHTEDASNETMNELGLYDYFICFNTDDTNNLIQTECPDEIDVNKLDLNYNFKLTKD